MSAKIVASALNKSSKIKNTACKIRVSNVKILRNKETVALAHTAVITIGVVVSLVLAVSIHGHRIFDFTRRSTELESVKESMVLFGESVESVAWVPEAASKVRFSSKVGCLQLFSSVTNYNISFFMDGGEYVSLYSHPTSVVRYRIPNFPSPHEYEEYIKGDKGLITTLSEDLSRIALRTDEGWATMTLDFKIRVVHIPNTVIQGEIVDLIKIWVIILNTPNKGYKREFDLKALGNKTFGNLSPQPYAGANATITVGLWQQQDSISFKIHSSKVYFQLIVGEVDVYV